MIRVVKERDSFQWHKWFAWYPLYIPMGLDGTHYKFLFVFWTSIWRKRQAFYSGCDWVYSVEEPVDKTK